MTTTDDTTTPTTPYNLELIREVRDLVAMEGQHKQEVWGTTRRSVLRTITDRFRRRGGEMQYIPVSCPTAACVAGWASIATGAKMLVAEEELELVEYGDVRSNMVLTTEGLVEDISEYGQRVLGLSDEEARRLFAGEWTTQQVLRGLDGLLVDGAHGRPWDLVMGD